MDKRPFDTIYFVTSNDTKYADFHWYVSRYEPTAKLQQVKIDFHELQTQDHKQIAIEKAKQAWEFLRKPLVVDDSGIYFSRYSNFPGPFLKVVYYGLGLDGMLKLLEDDNRATFLWYVVCAYGPGKIEVFEGRCEGVIIAPRHIDISKTRLQFSDIFIPTDLHKSPFKEKSKTDYQYRAIKKFFRWYWNKDKTGNCLL